jgi:hypothetical protein
MVVSYGLMRVLGLPLPQPELPLSEVTVLLPLFFG